jgi:hypothetical protein
MNEIKHLGLTKMSRTMTTKKEQCNLYSVSKRFWGGFGKIKTETEYCSTADPIISGLGINQLLAQTGFNTRWYECRLFIDDKPIFRYKSKHKCTMKVKRFLGVCWVNVY